MRNSHGNSNVKSPPQRRPKPRHTLEAPETAPEPPNRPQAPEDGSGEGVLYDYLASPCGSTLKRHRDPDTGTDLICCQAHHQTRGWECVELAAEFYREKYGVTLGQMMAGRTEFTKDLPWNEKTGGASRANGPPEALPTRAELEQGHIDLLNDPAVVRYLLGERGLTMKVIRKYRFAYLQPNAARPPGIVLPVGRIPPTFRIRYWPDLWQPPAKKREDGTWDVPEPVKISGPRNHAVQLWPWPPWEDQPTSFRILTEGELDAALLRSLGSDFPAWGAPGEMVPEPLLHQLAMNASSVAVVLDVGSDVPREPGQESPAARVLRILREECHVRAYRVDLGLPNRGDDVTDWFVKYRRSSHDFRHLLNAARAAQENENG
jgi:hypothetical protein